MHEVPQSHTGWTFLTNHARVLAAVADDSHTRIRDIAAHCRLTERAVQKIITELEEAGYLMRTRQGRSNTYRIKSHVPLRHPVEAEAGLTVTTLLTMLASHDEQRSSPAQPHQSATPDTTGTQPETNT
jgi:hypothetical protein